MKETPETVTQWANETFGQATIQRQFDRAMEEMLELEQAIRCNPAKVAEEAADVVICLYRIIGTRNAQAIDQKMARNRARKWALDQTGCAYHVEEG
jgi:NTP pyrophosphatase (non-canonical NTP hydrolase)